MSHIHLQLRVAEFMSLPGNREALLGWITQDREFLKDLLFRVAATIDADHPDLGQMVEEILLQPEQREGRGAAFAKMAEGLATAHGRLHDAKSAALGLGLRELLGTRHTPMDVQCDVCTLLNALGVRR